MTRLRSHRNIQGGYPEHSEPGILSSLRAGSDCIEIDLWPSSDGWPIASHDATVDAVSNGTGRVDSKTLAQLRALTLRPRGGSTIPGTQFLTLQEVIRLVAPYRTTLYLEPKTNDALLHAGTAKALADTGFPQSRLEWLAWASPANLYDVRDAIRVYSPTAPIYFVIGGTPTSEQTAIETLLGQGFAGGSFWPENFTADDYELCAEIGAKVSYYAAAPHNLNLWIEANEGPGPEHFLSDAISKDAAMTDYTDGWKAANGVSAESGLDPILFPAGSVFRKTVDYRTAGPARMATLTVRAEPNASRVRCWWFDAEFSDNAGNSWARFPASKILSIARDPITHRETWLVDLDNETGRQARLRPRFFPVVPPPAS